MSHLKKTLFTSILATMALILVMGGVLIEVAPAQAAKPALKPAISPGPLSHRDELRATVNAKAKLTRIDLRIDNKKVQPWVKAHAGWTYTIRYPLTKVAAGTHSIRLQVWNQRHQTTQRQWKFQKLAQLGLSADKISVQPGEKVILTGQGFTPGTAITIGMGGQNTGTGGNYGSAVIDTKGSFSAEVTLDKYPDGAPLHAGMITLVAHNSDGSEKAAVEIRVLPAPRLTLDKASIKPGDEVLVTGDGFTPGAVLSISLGKLNTDAGGNYGTAVADNTGHFALSVRLTQLPDGSPFVAGQYVLVARTADSQEKATAELQVQATPSLNVSKSTIRVGDWVILSGTGFTPGKVVSIDLAGAASGHGMRYGTAAVDANGRFSAQLFLGRYPDGAPLPPGTITLMASTADGEQAMVTLRVLATPAITLDKTRIQPGDRVMVSGQGFTPGAAVAISMGGVNTGASGNYGTAMTDQSGRFTLVVTPERYPNGLLLQAGPIVLVAHNAAWDEKATAQLQVVTLSATPMKVHTGDAITLKGEGFTPRSIMILSIGSVGGSPVGSYGSAVVDDAGRFVLTTKLTQYPDGSVLKPGSLALTVHDPTWSQRATVEIQILDRAPPGPSDLRITSLTKGTTSAEPTVVGLQWRDNASNETGFRIEATYTRMNGGTDTQVWHVATNTASAQVSFVAGGINPISKACFTVTAFNGQGDSSPSNEVCGVL